MRNKLYYLVEFLGYSPDKSYEPVENLTNALERFTIII